MLGNKKAVANVAVKDLDVAKDFYKNTLGLTPVHEQEKELVVFRSGTSEINVYRSDYAGTNKATAASWAVGDDFDAIVEDLRAKGVTFEQYDLPDTTREGDVHILGEFKAVWLKDPDGNILNLTNT